MEKGILKSRTIQLFLDWLGFLCGKKSNVSTIDAPTKESVPQAAAPVPAKQPQAKPRKQEAKPKPVPQEPEVEVNQQPEPLPMGKWTPPKGTRKNPDDVLFQDFPLDNRILRAILEDLEFKACTPIQGMVLPHALKGLDIAGKAQTGTGKTAAFLISMLHKFLTEKPDDKRQPNQPFALTLAPTRELAIQIAHDANELTAYCQFKTVAVYGGMDYNKQRRLLTSGVDLVVATPGRLIDYLNSQVVDLTQIKVLVIDEADRMLDMGFIPDVKRIVYRLGSPETRQTMLFSATLSRDIMDIAARWMRPNPVVLEAEPEQVVAEGIDETIYAVTTAEKMPILLWTLKNEDCKRVLIFRNRRRDVEKLHAQLLRYGVQSEMLSGDVDQKKRLRILEDFRSGKVKVIVATDVAGRGIHIDDITHVINFDFPYEAEDYVHRVGRTARAGQRGRAISFADEESAFVVPDIEQYISRPLPITHPEDYMLELPKTFSGLKDIPSGKEGSSQGGERRSHRDRGTRRKDGKSSSYRGNRVKRGGPRR